MDEQQPGAVFTTVTTTTFDVAPDPAPPALPRWVHAEGWLTSAARAKARAKARRKGGQR